jgi:hypothetical protein
MSRLDYFMDRLHQQMRTAHADLPWLLLSLAIQCILGLLFGHIYDIRIYMATGYMVAMGQNPYLPIDLSAFFQNSSFQGITSIGYPPPWPLLLGLIFRLVYSTIPNFLIYNFAIKIPIIAANIVLAYLVSSMVRRLGAENAVARKAWMFLLFNPFLLYASTAWGQIDSIVTVLALLALVLLDSRKLIGSAILFALSLSFKPIAFPLCIVIFYYLKGISIRQIIQYFFILAVCIVVFCALPFLIFRWDPSIILQNWNAHFVIGGGMSYMEILELTAGTYQLGGTLWWIGWLWIPALGIAAYALRSGIFGFQDLITRSTALILIFFLTKSWLSEPNLILVLPLVLILTLTGDLKRFALVAIWILPLAFSVFNSIPQVFFPSMPELMGTLLKPLEIYRSEWLMARMVFIFLWQILGWWIVFRCFRKDPKHMDNLPMITNP